MVSWLGWFGGTPILGNLQIHACLQTWSNIVRESVLSEHQSCKLGNHWPRTRKRKDTELVGGVNHRPKISLGILIPHGDCWRFAPIWLDESGRILLPLLNELGLRWSTGVNHPFSTIFMVKSQNSWTFSQLSRCFMVKFQSSPSYRTRMYQDPGRSFALSLARTLEHQGLRNSPDIQKLPMICWCHEWEASPKRWVVYGCFHKVAVKICQNMLRYDMSRYVRICQDDSRCLFSKTRIFFSR